MAVTSTNNLRLGSTGEDVKELQKLLNSKGNYNLTEDGSFGENTLAAVKDYQTNNGLEVDGIVGTNTWGKLTSGGTSATTPTTPADTTNKAETPAEPAKPTTTNGGFSYKDFVYDDFSSGVVDQANQLLQQHQATKPGSYTPVWQDEADAYLNQYQNRGPFSYDFNSDALYNQYKDNYIRQGKMAMMDTMGQAAAMTGGYGNSYAQNVGQQAYQAQLQNLNNILPELAQLAHNRYTQEGQDMLAMYDLYMNKENQAYGQYQDTLDRWYQESNRLQDNYNTLYNQEYGKYLDEKQIARDEYNAGKDMAWDEYLRELEKDEAAANLLASTGNYDRLQEMYGLSDEEVAAIKKANTKTSTSGTGPKIKYKELTGEEQDYWIKQFEKSDNPEWVAERMQDAGFDPEIVGKWYDNYATNPDPLPTATPLTDVGAALKDYKNQNSGFNTSATKDDILSTYIKLYGR